MLRTFSDDDFAITILISSQFNADCAIFTIKSTTRCLVINETLNIFFFKHYVNKMVLLHIFQPIAQLRIQTTARWLVCPQNDHSHHLSAFAYGISHYHCTSKNMNMKLTSFDKTMIIAQLVADLNKNTISEHHLPSKRPQTAHFAYGRHYHCIWFATITF